jgi:hypothetical protein
VDEPTGEGIATRAQEFKLAFLAQELCLSVLLDPAAPVLRYLQEQTSVGREDDIPIQLQHHSGELALTFSAREILTKVTRLRGQPIIDLMAMSMMTAATQLGDMIDRGGHRRTNVPLLEFSRHFRNACAHGDRWNFLNGAPRTTAACRGLTLTAPMHGQRATWCTVTPRLFVEYLDDLANHFVPGCVPPYPFT